MRIFCFLLLMFGPLLTLCLKLGPAIEETSDAYAKDKRSIADKTDPVPQIQIQYAICYDKPDCKGNSYWIIDEIRNLSRHGWDNKFSSCKFKGIWILYEDYNFIPDADSSVRF
jgi:hypothetical protein